MSNDNLSRLPEVCAVRIPGSGAATLIRRGESGHYPFDTDIDVDKFNTDLGVTKNQVSAMEAGSMFGWDCPAADPLTWEK